VAGSYSQQSMEPSDGGPMKYPDGQEARLGDRVELWDQNEGTVVCSLDTNEYSPDYPREH